jgi:hypothetical protein
MGERVDDTNGGAGGATTGKQKAQVYGQEKETDDSRRGESFLVFTDVFVPISAILHDVDRVLPAYL